MTGNLVTLRSIQASDLPILTQWNFDPKIAEHLPSRFPNSLEEQNKWYQNQLNNVSKKKLIIIDNNSSMPIGVLGFMDIDHVNKNCEIGITIGESEFWGKGHSKEAIELGLNFLFNNWNFNIVYLTVFESNKRGISFFEKIGFQKDGMFRERYYKNGVFINQIIMSIKNDNKIDG